MKPHYALLPTLVTGLAIGGALTTVGPGEWLELAGSNLQRIEAISSSCEVNRLIDRLDGECVPAVDLAHVDLS